MGWLRVMFGVGLCRGVGVGGGGEGRGEYGKNSGSGTHTDITWFIQTASNVQCTDKQCFSVDAHYHVSINMFNVFLSPYFSSSKIALIAVA